MECSRMNDLLVTYEQGYGQRLNNEKTSIHFSSNTSSESKIVILSMVGVRSSPSYERWYLSMFTLISKSRIQSRIEWPLELVFWKNNIPFTSWKGILLKSIIQAIDNVFHTSLLIVPTAFSCGREGEKRERVPPAKSLMVRIEKEKYFSKWA